MNKEFIPYEQALALKELGFDEPCFGYHNMVNHSGNFQFDIRIWENSDDYIEAPLYQQAFRWFRHKGIISEIHSDFDRMLGYNRGYIPVVQFIEFYNNGDCYETYEEAELACLIKLIEIVKKK